MFLLVKSLRFTFEEIMEATDHLNKKQEIGNGGFGRVFMGENLRSKGTTVAIKVLTKVNQFIEYFSFTLFFRKELKPY